MNIVHIRKKRSITTSLFLQTGLCFSQKHRDLNTHNIYYVSRITQQKAYVSRIKRYWTTWTINNVKLRSLGYVSEKEEKKQFFFIPVASAPPYVHLHNKTAVSKEFRISSPSLASVSRNNFVPQKKDTSPNAISVGVFPLESLTMRQQVKEVYIFYVIIYARPRTQIRKKGCAVFLSTLKNDPFKYIYVTIE